MTEFFLLKIGVQQVNFLVQHSMSLCMFSCLLDIHGPVSSCFQFSMFKTKLHSSSISPPPASPTGKVWETSHPSLKSLTAVCVINVLFLVQANYPGAVLGIHPPCSLSQVHSVSVFGPFGFPGGLCTSAYSLTLTTRTISSLNIFTYAFESLLVYLLFLNKLRQILIKVTC